MMDGHPPALPDTCTARLHATGIDAAAGILIGHPAPLHVLTRREHDRLVVRLLLATWDVGGGELLLNHDGDPPTWRGDVTISGCRWRCTSPRGSGVITFSVPQ
jgi:hypothetical protein